MLTVVVLMITAVFDYAPENKTLTVLPKLACVAAAACSWVLVLTALYVSYNVVGSQWIAGVQGRYFYPLVLPLLLLLKNNRFGAGVNQQHFNGACCVFAAGLSIAAAVHVFTGFCM